MCVYRRKIWKWYFSAQFSTCKSLIMLYLLSTLMLSLKNDGSYKSSSCSVWLILQWLRVPTNIMKLCWYIWYKYCIQFAKITKTTYHGRKLNNNHGLFQQYLHSYIKRPWIQHTKNSRRLSSGNSYQQSIFQNPQIMSTSEMCLPHDRKSVLLQQPPNLPLLSNLPQLSWLDPPPQERDCRTLKETIKTIAVYDEESTPPPLQLLCS